MVQQSYVDLPGRDLPDWKKVDDGDHLYRLSEVKSHDDPGSFFRFSQSIPLPERVSARG